jgi:hypothetical protein
MGKCSCSHGRPARLTSAGDQIIYYQYRADRARRSLHGIDEQVAKAENAVAGKTAVKRNRFVQLTRADKNVNRQLEAKARAVAGLKGYVTNLTACPDSTPITAEFVIAAYHRLIEVEKSFRMSKHDLQARPIYHHKRDSIEAHLTIVFAALAISRWIEQTTGWSIRKFVRTARRYRIIQIQVGAHTITAADPLPDDLRHALDRIHRETGTLGSYGRSSAARSIGMKVPSGMTHSCRDRLVYDLLQAGPGESGRSR